jgi:hypothetical protein
VRVSIASLRSEQRSGLPLVALASLAAAAPAFVAEASAVPLLGRFSRMRMDST